MWFSQDLMKFIACMVHALFLRGYKLSQRVFMNILLHNALEQQNMNHSTVIVCLSIIWNPTNYLIICIHRSISHVYRLVGQHSHMALTTAELQAFWCYCLCLHTIYPPNILGSHKMPRPLVLDKFPFQMAWTIHRMLSFF